MVCCCAVLSHLLQSYLTLCDLMDCSPPDSSVHGILEARVLELVAMASSRGSFQPRDQTLVSSVSALAGGFFTTSAKWKPHVMCLLLLLLLSRFSRVRLCATP